MVLKPHSLKKGDLIAIAAPASPFDVQELEKGVLNLQKLGFKTTYQENIFEKKAFLAGSDERRAQELQSYLENPEIKAIVFARGGWGTSRILPALKVENFQNQPKIVLGYSDMTSLLLYLQKLDWVVFHGPVVAKGMGSSFEERGQNSLLQCLIQEAAIPPFSEGEGEFIQEGKAQGILTGGCLSLLISSLKTPWELDAAGKILFIEDVNEAPYKVDRMLTHLKQAGKLEGIRGIVSGPFHSKPEDASLYEDILKEHFRNLNIPVLYNFPSGHLNNMRTLPFGIEVELDSQKKRFAYLEGACHAPL